jgi:ABC-type phosphate transport system permease subunit
VHVVKAVDGVVYGVYGVVWLTEIIRSCGKPTNKDVGFFSTMLWINQMLPNAAGRVMYVGTMYPHVHSVGRVVT